MSKLKEIEARHARLARGEVDPDDPGNAFGANEDRDWLLGRFREREAVREAAENLDALMVPGDGNFVRVHKADYQKLCDALGRCQPV